MAIKFNCPNPHCRQRIEVDDSMLGKTITCPACTQWLQTPISTRINFNCSNARCLQHIQVDISESGRHAQCPSCGKILLIPGAPPKILDAPNALPPALSGTKDKGNVSIPLFVEGAWKRVCLGWLACASIASALILGLDFKLKASLPRNLDVISDEVYQRSAGEIILPLAVTDNSLYFAERRKNQVRIQQLSLSAVSNSQPATVREGVYDADFLWIGASPDQHRLAYCIKGDKRHQSLVICGNSPGQPVFAGTLPSAGFASEVIWVSPDTLVLLDKSNTLYSLSIPSGKPPKGTSPLQLSSLFSSSNNLSSLIALTNNSFAYVMAGNIWSYDLKTAGNQALSALTNASPEHLQYNADAGVWLFNQPVPTGDTPDGAVCEFSQKFNTLSVVKNFAYGSQWVNNAGDIVYMELVGGRHRLTLLGRNGVALPDLFPGKDLLGYCLTLPGKRYIHLPEMNTVP